MLHRRRGRPFIVRWAPRTRALIRKSELGAGLTDLLETAAHAPFLSRLPQPFPTPATPHTTPRGTSSTVPPIPRGPCGAPSHRPGPPPMTSSPLPASLGARTRLRSSSVPARSTAGPPSVRARHLLPETGDGRPIAYHPDLISSPDRASRHDCILTHAELIHSTPFIAPHPWADSSFASASVM